jgi:ATP-dependent helicase HepA
LDNQFIPGQRWVNHAELQLGLGTVLTSEHRRVTLLFSATGETRTYSTQSAPLSRALYKPGDSIKDREGTEIIIQDIEVDKDGLYKYQGADHKNTRITIHEIDIDASQALHGPAERLLAGLVDHSKWFHLRHLALSSLGFIHHHPIATITGCRVDLVPHQIYIAREVSGRYAPRVLLADQVGLGKTIEAGLILHQQLYYEQIRRVLIVVPDNLLHQWLVEMLRRFNLQFSLFDHERHMDSRELENPFLDEQLVLCGLNTLTQNNAFYNDVLSAGWDMMVVDEAHHLAWSPEVASPPYMLIEKLANSIAGVLLLTATPEQLGKVGHFARLRLLDPDRFHDFESFLEEEKNYEPVAQAVQNLFDEAPLEKEVIKDLEDALNTDLSQFKKGPSDEPGLSSSQKNSLINHLLDLHGTGRVLFRNTRAAITGFPDRQLLSYPLPKPEAYHDLILPDSNNLQYLASLEMCYQEAAIPWTRVDPRVDCLKDLYDTLKPEKILVITHARQSVIELAEFLKARHGIYPAVFHEAMTILERDRAAEYFADPENGTRIMICSEIGSEGRNFQFAHHLVLFDLPLVPDLLEQRIGRLDRIGQRHPVKIHVLYIELTAQEVLFKWYRDGLEAFTNPCQTGQEIYHLFSETLTSLIKGETADIDDFIGKTRDANLHLLKDLENGRDRLLEYHSCPPYESQALRQQAMEIDQEDLLEIFMESAFDCFGIDSEEHSEHSLILRPGEDMVTSFPHLPDEGTTVTYSRQTALVHENWQYLGWTHPMVIGALDLALSYEKGNATAVSFSSTDINPGTLLLECNYVIQINPEQDFILRNLVAPQVIRMVIDESGKQYQDQLPHQYIESSRSYIDKVTAGKIVSMKQTSIRNMIEHSRTLVMKLAPDIIKSSREDTFNHIQSELVRLETLAKTNANIRQVEMEFLKHQGLKVESIFDSIVPRLDAVRLLIST